MPDETPSDGEYRAARQWSAGLLTALVVVIVLGDQTGIMRPVEPATLFGLLLAAAGLLAVDLPGLRR